MKPGWKTSEFWVSLMAGAAGLYLIVFGVRESNQSAMTIGAGLLASAGVGYSISRGMAK